MKMKAPLLTITPRILSLIDLALDEDAVDFDVTSNIFFSNRQACATLRAKQDLILAGSGLVTAVFDRFCDDVRWEFDVRDGQEVKSDQVFATGYGTAHSLLRGERTALNFLQRLSGIATGAQAFVRQTGAARTRIVDTRKTLPGWRPLDKYAVACGGASNHRYSLSGGVMIKDNHIAAAGGIDEAVRLAKASAPHSLRIQVEVQNLEQVKQALVAGAEIIMLDNMTDSEMEAAITVIRANPSSVLIEASGNMTCERVGGLVGLDLDFISVGALTHSVMAADISMSLSLDEPAKREP
jgi:nicotinate-nucleotide pyrophosphorylase (carboxylating)